MAHCIKKKSFLLQKEARTHSKKGRSEIGLHNAISFNGTNLFLVDVDVVAQHSSTGIGWRQVQALAVADVVVEKRLETLRAHFSWYISAVVVLLHSMLPLLQPLPPPPLHKGSMLRQALASTTAPSPIAWWRWRCMQNSNDDVFKEEYCAGKACGADQLIKYDGWDEGGVPEVCADNFDLRHGAMLCYCWHSDMSGKAFCVCCSGWWARTVHTQCGAGCVPKI